MAELEQEVAAAAAAVELQAVVVPDEAQPQLQLQPADSDEQLAEKPTLSVSEQWQAYLDLRKAHWPKVPDVFIRYEDLAYNVEIPRVPDGVPNLVTAVRDSFMRPFVDKSKITKPLKVLSPVSGCIAPGRMTLVLAEPGGGKSTLLKLLAGQPPEAKCQSGRITFNGHTREELEAMPEGTLRIPRIVSYMDQQDHHISMLTVRETLQFAMDLQSVQPHWIAHEELCEYQRRKVDQIIELMGLNECADTIVGNDIVRGVSGGQKKRVTIAEMLMGEAKAIFADEITNGLDSAVAFDILNSLRMWVKTLNCSVVTALMQPTPEVYELFDDVILLRGGKVLYHGPREQVPGFMEAIGVPIPATMDEADFLTEFLTNSVYVAKKYGSPSDQPLVAAAAEEHKKQDFFDHPADAAAGAGDAWTPDITSAALQAVYQKTPAHRELMERAETHPLGEVDMNPLSEFSRLQYGRAYSSGALQQFNLCLRREFMTMRRDKGSVIPRIAQTIFMAFLLSTLFWDLAPENYYTRLGLILFSAISVSFGNMVELPKIFEAKSVLIKHNVASMLRVMCYTVSVDSASIPLRFVETMILGSALYWATGFAPEGGRFVLAIVILLLLNMAMSAYFKVVSSTVPNQPMAQLFAGPSVLVFFVFAGFVISRDTMAPPFLVFYYLSPIGWCLRGMSILEFKAERYDSPMVVDGRTERTGDFYLESLEFSTRESEIAVGAVILVAYFFVFTGISFLAQRAARHHQPGTQRLITALEDTDDERTFFGQRATSPTNWRQQKSVQESIGFVPVNLVWRDLHYTVTLEGGEKRPLLRGVSGHCTPGTLTAMLGSSGAGKSTLMDVIAGRKTAGQIEGEILVNGKPKNPRTFGRIAGYVEQQDIHNGTSTVREALAFAANLRLPQSVPAHVKVAMVDEVLELLELAEIQDRITGDETIVGLAPGERKRLTIGVELVANPSVLFLDEPTSGLDSRSAMEVVRVLRRIAATGRSVLCTVHQPSAELFSHFDRLLLLGAGGRETFFGSNDQVRDYFQSLPGVEPCGRQNPATWILNVVGNTAISPEQASLTFHQAYRESPLLQANQAEIQRFSEQPVGDQKQGADLERHYAQDIWTQFMMLQLRSFRSLFRSVQFTLSRFVVLTLAGILFGLIYFDVGNNPTTFAEVNSVIGLIFTTSTFGSVIFCTTSLPYLFDQRAVFYRETGTNAYSKWVYGPSLIFQDWPYVLGGSLVFVVPMYWLAGLSDAESGGVFFQYWLGVILLQLTFVYLGQLLSALLPDMIKAGIALGFCLSTLNLFGGLFIYKKDIPDPWIWVYHINPIPKLIRALLATQFKCDLGAACPTMTIPEQGEVVIHDWVRVNFDLDYENGYWEELGWLALTAFIFLVIIMLALSKLNHIKR